MTATQMSVADFVAKVANPYFSLSYDLLHPSENFLDAAIEYAVKNKIFPLLYDGCISSQIKLPKKADFLIKGYYLKRQAQIKASKFLINLQEKHNIDLLFFKTFRPFNYIPDDVDVLVREPRGIEVLSRELKRDGYFLLKVGTPEISFRKVQENTYVDLDIHKRLAVGSVDLFDVESLWQKHAFETLDLGDGCKGIKFSEDYEVVREAAYSLLKDFKISMSGLYLGINALLNRQMEVIQKIAFEENFVPHLKLYEGAVKLISQRLFSSDSKMMSKFGVTEISNALRLCRNLRAPYPYPVTVITWAYLTRALLEIQRKKNVSILFQIAKQPSSKGMDILFDYIREYL